MYKGKFYGDEGIDWGCVAAMSENKMLNMMALLGSCQRWIEALAMIMQKKGILDRRENESCSLVSTGYKLVLLSGMARSMKIRTTVAVKKMPMKATPAAAKAWQVMIVEDACLLS